MSWGGSRSVAEAPELGGVRRILFVCTGNTCRSPMAEAIARVRAEDRGQQRLEIRSAGTMASGEAPASRGAVLVAREAGLELEGHRSTSVTPGLVAWADLVVCMAPSHRMDVEEVAPDAPTVLMTEFLPEDHPLHGRPVSDPVGAGPDVYRETLATLRDAVEGLLDRLEGA